MFIFRTLGLKCVKLLPQVMSLVAAHVLLDHTYVHI